MENLIWGTFEQLSEGLEKKQFSSVELTKAFIARTYAIDKSLKAFLNFDEKKTLAEAEASDVRRSRGQSLGRLDGVPVGLKDIFAEKGQRLTCGSRILEHFVSPYDATVVKKLKDAGAVLWGRLNMDEFAMGSSSENSAFQVTSNPWDLDRVPGGSSSGSAAAVAAGEVSLSLGTDTGGSVRQPASMCGVVGLKPSYGCISRYGMVAYASSLDQAGPLARTAGGVAALLQVLSGADPKDSTCARMHVPDYLAAVQSSEGKKWILGVPEEYFGEGLDSEVKSSVEKAIHFYEAQGYIVKPVHLTSLEYAIPVYYIIATAEASSNLARYDGIRYTYRSPRAKNIDEVYDQSRSEGLGEEVKRRILLGTYVLSSGYYDAFYGKAQKVRRLIYNDFMRAFAEVDVLVTPTSPVPAFKKGEKTSDPLAMYLSDLYTISVNLAGLPAISFPCGFTNRGLPIGCQLIGKPWEETTLLSMAYTFEKHHPFNLKIPNL
ncbi:MAG: Asp-tRNA(Asn)/Glu-tRNA(Gln) amidotransferase subunit GatA [Puniceicoccales bacterium]|jgi:aspartyl-tRNA(Asn)/glutamyl-tRNA(Gln) amidotransferase subunit A|nr:Asp-tRNA(Asn)/Glu-tRNA(Gln) amidotransferase subunit GatA [Puniceicoccales bacterium]